jgi:hypothetical protein
MMPMRIRRKTRPIEKLENPTALQCGGRSFPCDHPTQFTLASMRPHCSAHLCERVEGRDRLGRWSLKRRTAVSFMGVLKRAKLLRGHALSDMWDLPGKVAEYCGKSRLDARQTRKLLRDRAEVSCGATALVLG